MDIKLTKHGKGGRAKPNELEIIWLFLFFKDNLGDNIIKTVAGQRFTSQVDKASAKTHCLLESGGCVFQLICENHISFVLLNLLLYLVT